MIIFTLGIVTFSFLIYFWQLLMCQMRQKERIKFCLDTRNNKALPFLSIYWMLFDLHYPGLTTPILSRIFQSSCFLCCMSYSTYLSSTEPKTLQLYILDNDLTLIWKINPLGAYQAIQSSTQKHVWRETTFHLSPHLTFWHLLKTIFFKWQ